MKTSKACCTCGEQHTRYRDRNHTTFASHCHKCHAKYMREHRPKHRDLPPEAKAKAVARAYAKVYLSRGKLTKQPCIVCGSKKVQMHHENYLKPLKVTWMCRPCHLAHHRKT